MFKWEKLEVGGQWERDNKLDKDIKQDAKQEEASQGETASDLFPHEPSKSLCPPPPTGRHTTYPRL